MSAAAISAPPGFPLAAMSRWRRPCWPAPTMTATSSNMTLTAPAALSRCGTCPRAIRSWWSASSPRNSASLKRRTTSSADWRKRPNSRRWSSSRCRRNAVLPRPRRAISFPRKSSGPSCGSRSKWRARCGGGEPARFHAMSADGWLMRDPRSDRLELAVGKPHHLQQQPAVAEPRDLSLTEGASSVMDRGLDDLQILLRCPKDQIEIAKRIEVAEIIALTRQHFVVFPQQHLGAAQRVRQPGVDEISEQIGKAAIGDEIERAHRFVFHRVD